MKFGGVIISSKCLPFACIFGT